MLLPSALDDRYFKTIIAFSLWECQAQPQRLARETILRGALRARTEQSMAMSFCTRLPQAPESKKGGQQKTCRFGSKSAKRKNTGCPRGRVS